MESQTPGIDELRDQLERLTSQLEKLRRADHQRRSAEDSARHPSRILRSVLDSIAEGVVVVDAKGRFLHFNPAAEQIIGMGPREVPLEQAAAAYGCYLPDTVTPFPAEQLPLLRATHGEEVNEEEMFVRHEARPEGVWLSCNARPLRGENGTIAGGVVAFRDITARKAMDIQAHRHQEALEQRVLERTSLLNCKELRERQLQGLLRTQLEITHQLSRAESVDDLCRQAIEQGRSRLGFDRLSIWFFEQDTTHIFGTFGIDEQGNLRDERHHRRPAHPELLNRVRDARPGQYFRSEGPLRNGAAEQVGHGVRVWTFISDGQKFIGYLAADNLLRREPIDDPFCELMALYASSIGHLCSLKRTERDLRANQAAMQRSRERMRDLLEISDQLSETATPDDVCRRAVELVTSRLGFDRASIWLLEEDPSHYRGTFGTDEHGRLRDERSRRLPISDVAAQMIADDHPGQVFRERVPLNDDHGQVIGEGGHVWTLLWDGQKAIGFLGTDNLLTGNLISQEDLEVLMQFASAFGHVYAAKHSESELAHSLSLLRATLDSTAEAFLLVSSDHRVVTYNPRVLEMWGLTDEVMAKGDHEAIRQILPLLSDPEGFVARVEAIHRQPGQESFDVIHFRDGRVVERYSRPQLIGNRVVGRAWSFLDITDKVRAAETLSETENRLGRVVESLPLVLYSADGTTHRPLLLHGAVRRLFGHEPDQLKDDPEFPVSVIHPEDRARVHRAYARQLAAGEPFELQYRIIHGEHANEAWVQQRVTPVYDDQGRLVREDCVLLDITKRKLAEQQLEKSHSLLQATFEATADGLLVVDRNQKVVSFNRRFLEMWRIPETATASRSDDDLLEYAITQLRNPQAFLDKVRDVYLHPEEDSFDTLEFKDGRTFERLSRPQRIAGRAVGRVWSFRNITERRRAEASLRASEERLRTVVTSAPVILFALDRDGVFTLSEGTGLEVLGMASGEVVGRSVFEVYRDVPQIISEVRRALAGESFTSVVKLGDLTFETRHSPLIDEHGNVIGVIGVSTDVTERERLQHQLLQTQKLESIGTLAGGIAHDFNNLLAVIIGNASLHLRDPNLPVRLRDALNDMVTAAERGSELTHQLLAFARGGLQKPAPTAINQVVRAVLAILRRTTHPQVAFATRLSAELPAVIGGAGQIEQVVMNLWLNAIQACEPPTTIEAVTETVELDRIAAVRLQVSPGSYVLLEVRDDGCGMSPEVLARIFEPFYTTKPTGRGMGLSATQGIVKSHRGAIDVESMPGRGTTMRVYLPAAADHDLSAAAVPASLPVQRPPRGDETVLVIDDDEAVARTMVEILLSLGYCAIAHTNPDDGLAFLDSNNEDIDLVVLDVNVPRYTPEQMFNQVVRRAVGKPVLLTSGYDLPESVRELIGRGAAGFLHKPFDFMAYSVSVRDALDHRSRRGDRPAADSPPP